MWRECYEWTGWPRIWAYLAWQGRDPGTWRGFVLLAMSITAWNVTSADDKATIWITIGMFVSGLINVIAPPPSRPPMPEGWKPGDGPPPAPGTPC
jgi:hypothetical protein